jgi:hypothetical protein
MELSRTHDKGRMRRFCMTCETSRKDTYILLYRCKSQSALWGEIYPPETSYHHIHRY